MFAVVETGNKQYQVQVGDVIKTERLEGDVGTVIALDKVLITSQKVGAPLVEGAIVEAEILDQRKDDKVLVFKKKRRHNYRRKKGHRQYITVLKVTNIKS
ncbi:MAG: 50S ribosomal protein L21 [Alphaproteobacteria bacterium]|jgi:large subunit ribosomal protein L21|nr:50S ribosomal protein L21 [Candidatus Jidaibacter sp.]